MDDILIHDTIYVWFVMMIIHLWLWSTRLFSTNSQILTFLNFPQSHAFRDGSLRMILDSNSSNMEKPNVIKWKQAMNFYTSIATFLREFVGKFWGKLWTLTTSHGFLVWSWLNQHIWHNFSHPSSLHFHLLHC